MKMTAQFSGVSSPLSVELMLMAVWSSVLESQQEPGFSRRLALLARWANFLSYLRTICVSSFRMSDPKGADESREKPGNCVSLAQGAQQPFGMYRSNRR